MTGTRPDDPRRFMPPELRAAAGYAEPGTAGGAQSDVASLDVAASDTVGLDVAASEAGIGRSRAYRFFHAAAWKYVIGGLALLLLLALFGMMCSPVYWRF